MSVETLRWLVRRHVDAGESIDDIWASLDRDERLELLYLADYHEHYEKVTKLRRGKGQRVARALLRTLLDPSQLRQSRIAHRGIDVVGPETGLMYRLHANSGITQLVSPGVNGMHYEGSFCLHGDEDLPPADVSIAHLLWIRTDEMGFLETANFHPHYRTTVGQAAGVFICAIDEGVT